MSAIPADTRKIFSRPSTVDTVNAQFDLNVKQFDVVQIMAVLSAGAAVINVDLFVPVGEGGTGTLYRLGTITPDADGIVITIAVSAVAPSFNAIPGHFMRLTVVPTASGTTAIDVVGR